MAAPTYALSTSEAGTIITMETFVDPSNSAEYLKLCGPITAEFRKHPENLFAAICVDPTNAGHIKIVHGWTKPSAWWFETFVHEEGCINKFNAELSPMWIKPRIIEHFDRYIEE
ncbi:hypothetical protein V8E51_004578 [Hyaloscypha variabilis]